MIKAITGLVGLAALTVSWPALAQAEPDRPPPILVTMVPPPNAEELAEARAIIAIMFPPAQREEMFRTMIGQVRDQVAASIETDRIEDPGLREILDHFLQSVPERLMPLVTVHLPKILEATATAYTHEFDLAELKEIHAFAQSPAGGHYLSRSLALVGDPSVAEANSNYFAELQAHSAIYREELQQEIVDYLKTHPDVARQVTGSQPD